MSNERHTVDEEGKLYSNNQVMQDHLLPAPGRAARVIQDMIRTGRLAPGQRLHSQRLFAEELGVSRASLREALSTLEALGFLQTVPKKGTFVVSAGGNAGAALSAWKFSHVFDLPDVYQYRYMVEPVACRLAAVRITSSDFAKVASLHDEYRAALNSIDLVSAADYDYQFHWYIMQFTGNMVFLDVYEKLTDILQETQMLPFARHDRLWEPAMEHGKILESLRQRDPDGAAYYMSLHIVRATERIGVRINDLI